MWRLCNKAFENDVVPEDWRSVVINRARRVIGGLIDDEQWGFRAVRGCVDQIFTLKQIDEKTLEKKRRAYVGFIDLEKA